MSTPGAYGAGMAGGAFDPMSFIRKPQVITRVVCWVFSIVVFACISTGAGCAIKLNVCVEVWITQSWKYSFPTEVSL